ncbi:MAG: HlyD family efflux transporter periplasmic adaptor subunit [Planctomycetota bacterium]
MFRQPSEAPTPTQRSSDEQEASRAGDAGSATHAGPGPQPTPGPNPWSGVLAVQCRMAGADAAVMLRLPSGEGEPQVEATFVAPTPPGQQGVAKPALSDDWWRPMLEHADKVKPLGRAVVSQRREAPESWSVMLWAGEAEGVGRRLEVFAVRASDQRELGHRVSLLEVSRTLIDLRTAQATADRAQAQAAAGEAVLTGITAFNAAGKCRAAAMALCNDLARRLEAERVSLGFGAGDAVHLHTVSDTEHVQRRMSVSRDIEAAMEEAVDQDAAVPWPCDPTLPIVARAAGELASRHGAKHIVTLPLRGATRHESSGDEAEAVGALTIEREVDRAITADELDEVRRVLDLVTPRLLELRERDRWVGARWASGVRWVGAMAVGPKHTWAKLLAVAVFAVAAVVTIGRGTDWVESSFVIEPVVQRVVPAPADGYLQDAFVEPGDEVIGGETVLGRLDTSELEVRLAQLVAERSAATSEADMAWREGDAAKRLVAQARADEISAQIDLVNYQIERAELIAPIDGVVVMGDWRKELGTPVEKGRVLFEVAPLDRYRATMMVPESRVFDVWPGQTGELAAAALPGQKLAFEVERVHPVAEVADQTNVFPVKVRLIGRVGDEEGAAFEPPSWVRPGVEGVAKADAGRKPWIWLWVRDGVNWVRMKLWW